MSKAEELVNSLDSARTVTRLAGSSDEEHIVIGDDRVIVVPDELKRLAVQYDHNVETVTFDCPRYWDEHDMSGMSVYINYLRVDGKSGIYRAENITVDDTDDSIMHFDWTISRNVSEVSGQLVFLVCVRKADEDGFEETHWNSELCKTCYVSEGLEVDLDEFKVIYPDLIEQWRQDVFKIIYDVTEAKQDMLDDVNNAISSMNAEVTEAKQDMMDDVNSAKDNMTASVTTVVEETIAMRDAGDFNGATFTPSVSSSGDLSWTNDKGKANPSTVNIKGPQGVSPTIQVEDIQGGHRLSVTDVDGTTEVDIMNTIIDSSDAVKQLLTDFIYIGDTEPTLTPSLWLDTTDTIPVSNTGEQGTITVADLEAMIDQSVDEKLEGIENGVY